MYLPFVSDGDGLYGTWWFFDELKDVDFGVLDTQVLVGIEMSTDTFVLVVVCDVPKVVGESVFET